MFTSVQNLQAQSDLYACTQAWSTLNNLHNEYSRLLDSAVLKSSSELVVVSAWGVFYA